MGIFDWFSRGGRVARGKANAAMESLEDATFETTLKQSIRDMKEDLRQLVNSSADAVANATRLEREHQKLLGQSTEWRDKAKAALKAGKEDLAKKALAQHNSFDKESTSLEPQVKSSRQVAESLKARIQKLKERIEEAERSASTLVARRNAAMAQKKVAAAVANLGEDDNAFGLLTRFEQSVEKEEAAALAYDEMAAGHESADLNKQFAELGMDSAVDDDLAALKAELDEK